MNISDHIKSRMHTLNMRAVDVANLTGVSKATVSQWVNGMAQPSGTNLIALCKTLKCSPDWILRGDGHNTNPPKQSEGHIEILSGISVWDKASEAQGDDELAIPFFKGVHLSAGAGYSEIKEYSDAKIRFSRSTLARLGIQPEAAVCAKVSGNSMEPNIPDGAIVGIDTYDKDISDGKIYAINHDGMLRIKIMYLAPGNGIRLRSFNTEEHPDETYTKEHMDTVLVIGRVFWYSVII